MSMKDEASDLTLNDEQAEAVTGGTRKTKKAAAHHAAAPTYKVEYIVQPGGTPVAGDDPVDPNAEGC